MSKQQTTFFAEGLPIIGRVQQRLSSRGYLPGPLMIDQEKSRYSEHAVATIQRQWCDAMGVANEQ